MGLVDLCQTLINNLFMQLLLLLEPEYLTRLLGEYLRYTVKGSIMEIRVIGRDDLHRGAKLLRQGKSNLEPSKGFMAPVHSDHDLPPAEPMRGVLDDQRIPIRPPH